VPAPRELQEEGPKKRGGRGEASGSPGDTPGFYDEMAIIATASAMRRARCGTAADNAAAARARAAMRIQVLDTAARLDEDRSHGHPDER
jgi:hypothetical protein